MSFDPCDHHIQAEKLLRLKEDWNSYGAPPISSLALEAAMRCLNGIVLVPTAKGGVTLELHMNGMDLELEFAPDGSCSFFVEVEKVERKA